MVVGHVCRIVVFVAIYAAKQGVVARRRVAIRTLIPLSIVFAAVYREVHAIMVKSSRRPGGLAMTGYTVCGESRRRVVGIIGCIVVSQVAAYASIGRIVVVAVVTSRTVVGYAGMSANQSPEAVVYRESSRIPIGVGSMAHFTVGRQG